jgi:hypothetical protein
MNSYRWLDRRTASRFVSIFNRKATPGPSKGAGKKHSSFCRHKADPEGECKSDNAQETSEILFCDRFDSVPSRSGGRRASGVKPGEWVRRCESL